MPGERQRAQRLDLGQAFLQVVLAEVAQPERGRGGQGPGLLPLADRQERDGVDTPAMLQRGGGDALAHGAQPGLEFLRDEGILRKD